MLKQDIYRTALGMGEFLLSSSLVHFDLKLNNSTMSFSANPYGPNSCKKKNDYGNLWIDFANFFRNLKNA